MTRRLEWTIIILSLIGVTDTAYLSYARLADSPLSCSILEGCNTVAASEYSVLFGVPLAYLGFAFYLAIFALGVALLARNTPFVRVLLLIFAFAGLVLSSYFFYLQALVIEAFCVYCLISAIISVLLFLVSLLIYRKGERPGTAETEN